MLSDLFSYLAAQDPFMIGIVLLVALAVEGTLLIGLAMPSDVAILVAGSALEGPLEVIGVAFGGILGCFAGATGGYVIGHLYGARVRHGRVGRWVGERRWERAERAIRGRAGGLALAVAYFLPVAHALTPILAGTLGVPYRRFIRWAMAGSCVWVTFYLTLGTVMGGTARAHEGLIVPLAAAVAVLVLTLGTILERLTQRGDVRRAERPRAGR